MGAQISADYPEGPLYLITVLKGAFIFMADLARAIETPSRIEFMGISSYGKDKTSSGQVKVTKDLDVSIEGQDVLIVEDIIDSGMTLNYLINLLQQRHPKSHPDRNSAGQARPPAAAGRGRLHGLSDSG